MTARISPLATVGFLILIGVNAWLVSVLVDDSAPDDAIVTGSLGNTTKLHALPDVSLTGQPIASYSLTLAQPIFFRTRAPFVAPPAPPPPMSVAPPPVYSDPGLVLGGVMVTGNIRKAYLFTKADPHGTWVDEGETFKGWKVQSVQSMSTLLQQQSRNIELHLYPPH